MATIKRTERMSVGVGLLDAGHRVFIRLIDMLEANAGIADRRSSVPDRRRRVAA